jgi:hypothetical protein
MQKRKPFADPRPPITPDLVSGTPINTEAVQMRKRITELGNENRKLHAMLSAERRANQQTQRVLIHHIEAIEKSLTSAREAFFENAALRLGERQ